MKTWHWIAIAAAAGAAYLLLRRSGLSVPFFSASSAGAPFIDGGGASISAGAPPAVPTGAVTGAVTAARSGRGHF